MTVGFFNRLKINQVQFYGATMGHTQSRIDGIHLTYFIQLDAGFLGVYHLRYQDLIVCGSVLMTYTTETLELF